MFHGSFQSKRVSDKEKYANDFALAKEIADSLIPVYDISTTFIAEEKRIDRNYKLINNEIDFEVLESMKNPMGLDVGQNITNIKAYNMLPAKLNMLAGEELKRSDQVAPLLLNTYSLYLKDKEHRERVTAQVKLRVQAELLKNKAQLEQMPPEEAEKAIQELEQQMTPIVQPNFQSSLEVLANDIMEYMTFDGSLKAKKNTSFRNVNISARELVYVGYRRGRPFFDPVNPRGFFHGKSNEEPFIQKGDYAGRRYSMTIPSIISEFGNSLSKKDLDSLYERANKTSYNYDPSRIDSFNNNTFARRQLKKVAGSISHDDVGYVLGDEGRYTDDKEWVTHISWRWPKKVGFLTHYNEYGNEIVTIVDESFVIPEEAVKVKFINDSQEMDTRWEFVGVNEKPMHVSFSWVDRVWELTRIGEDIYTNIREVAGQPTNPERIHDVNLPYYGYYLDNYNVSPMSPVDRAIDFLYLSFIAMDQLRGLLSRNLGALTVIDVSQIPASLGEGGKSALQMAMFYNREGFAFSNSGETNNGIITNTRGKGVDVQNVSVTQEIMNLVMIYDWLNEKVGECIGITKPREGATSANSNVSDNQQSIIQSNHVTEYIFFQHNMLWADVKSAYLNLVVDWAKDYFERHPNKTEFLLPFMKDQGNQATLKIMRDGLEFAEYGVYMIGVGGANEYYDKMEQVLLPLIQNNMEGVKEVSTILKARSQGATPEKIHNLITRLYDEKKAQEQKYQEIAAQQEEKKMELRKKEIEDLQSHDIDKIRIKAREERDTQVLVTTLKNDYDSDGINDDAEDKKLMTQVQLEREKIQVQREKIAANERVAKTKAKTTTKK